MGVRFACLATVLASLCQPSTAFGQRRAQSSAVAVIPVASKDAALTAVSTKLPTEKAFIAFCQRASAAVAKTKPGAALPAADQLGWYPTLISAPLTNAQSIKCALTSLVYWDAVAVSHGDATHSNEYRTGDNLLWQIEDQLEQNDTLGPNETQKALAAFKYQLNISASVRLKANLTLAAAILFPKDPQPGTADESTGLAAITGISVSDILRDPSKLTDWAGEHVGDAPDKPSSSSAYYKQTGALWNVVERVVGDQLSGRPSTALDGTEYRTGDPAIQIATLVAAIKALPQDVLRRILIDRMKSSQPVKLGTLVGSGVSNSQMVYDFSGSAYAGRCNTLSLVNAALTTAKDWQAGQVCQYSPGTNGESTISVNQVNSSASWSGVQYYAEVYSFAHGGYWNHGSENETSTVQYSASGLSTIEQCNNVSTCGPFVEIHYKNLSQIGDTLAIDPTESLSVGYKGVHDADFTVIPADARVLVDRSEGPVQIRIEFSRNYTHHGACCVPAYVIQAVRFYATTDSHVPYDFDTQNWPVGVLGFLQKPAGPVPAGVTLRQISVGGISFGIPIGMTLGNFGSWRGLGYLLASDDAFRDDISFDDRFAEYYLRLELASQLETMATPLIDSSNSKTIALSRIALSNALASKYLETARESYRATSSVYTVIPFANLIRTLNAAIEELGKGILPPGKDPLADIANLQNQLGTKMPADLANNTDSTRKALAAKRQADALLGLIGIRAQLWKLEDQWRSKIADLVTEVSLFDPALASDPTRI